MGLAHHYLGLVLGEGGDELAILATLDPVERDLDAVDPVLDLAADLLDRFRTRRHQLADRGFGCPDPGRVPVGQPLMGRHITPGCHDSWPVEEARTDRIADRQADLPGVARRADRGEAGGGDLLGEEHAAQGTEFERAVEVDVLLALGVAIGEVSVDVDEPRHTEKGPIVEQMVVARAPRRALFGADIVEHAALVEDQGLACPSIVLLPGEEMAAADKGFHGLELLVEGSQASLSMSATPARLPRGGSPKFVPPQREDSA